MLLSVYENELLDRYASMVLQSALDGKVWDTEYEDAYYPVLVNDEGIVFNNFDGPQELCDRCYELAACMLEARRKVITNLGNKDAKDNT